MFDIAMVLLNSDAYALRKETIKGILPYFFSSNTSKDPVLEHHLEVRLHEVIVGLVLKRTKGIVATDTWNVLAGYETRRGWVSVIVQILPLFPEFTARRVIHTQQAAVLAACAGSALVLKRALFTIHNSGHSLARIPALGNAGIIY